MSYTPSTYLGNVTSIPEKMFHMAFFASGIVAIGAKEEVSGARVIEA